jgi:hypothetical protein
MKLNFELPSTLPSAIVCVDEISGTELTVAFVARTAAGSDCEDTAIEEEGREGGAFSVLLLLLSLLARSLLVSHFIRFVGGKISPLSPMLKDI